MSTVSYANPTTSEKGYKTGITPGHPSTGYRVPPSRTAIKGSYPAPSRGLCRTSKTWTDIPCNSGTDTLVAKMIGMLNARKQGVYIPAFTGYVARQCLLETSNIKAKTVEEVLLKAEKAVVIKVVRAAWQATYEPEHKDEQARRDELKEKVEATVKNMAAINATVTLGGNGVEITIQRDPNIDPLLQQVSSWITTAQQQERMAKIVPCTEDVEASVHVAQTLQGLRSRLFLTTKTFGARK